MEDFVQLVRQMRALQKLADIHYDEKLPPAHIGGPLKERIDHNAVIIERMRDLERRVDDRLAGIIELKGKGGSQ